MSYLVYLVYPLLAVFLFWGAKVYKRNEWNTEFLSLTQTKALQGFCAIAIMLHHISQKTCAPWLNPKVVVHGLDVFVTIGYWFVGIFVFCSGYGLWKSFQEKPEYLKGFFSRRILPLIVAFCTSSIIFQFARGQMNVNVSFFASPFQVDGPDLANPYAWYMIMLPVLYIGFYLAFRFCKKERTAILVTAVIALAYIAHCDFWMYGSWWYNAVPVFVIGIMVAKYEKTIIGKWKKHYAVNLIILVVLAAAFQLLAEKSQNVFLFFQWNCEQEWFRWIRILSQMAACVCFTLSVFLIGMKVRIGNKALAFMGTITLEFYLIHGVFVQLFGYCFMSDLVVPLYYIRNVALFVLVVLVLAVISAFLLHKGNQLIVKLLMSQKNLIAVITRDAKKFALIVLGLFCLVTVVLSVSARNKSRQAAKTVEDYSRDTIRYADVDGKKMAAYVTGEGKHTVVILRASYDPCPTLTMKPIADDLAKSNHVVILDYFGNGFSDDTEKERSADNMVNEIYTALDSLGEEGPFVLMPIGLSAVYAQLYAEMYPQKVEAIAGINGNVAEQMKEMIRVERINVGDLCRRERKSAKFMSLKQRLIGICGYTEIQWPYYESLFYHTHTRTELTVMQELFGKKMYGRNTVEELSNEYENTMKILNHKYAQDLPVLMILDYSSCNVQWMKNKNSYLVNPNLDWQMLHESQFTNTEIQKVEVMSGDQYLIYYNPHAVSQNVQNFIEQLN